MYPYLPVPVGELTDGEGVIEVLRVLGVYGESRHSAEILAQGDFLGSNVVGNLVGGFLHVDGIFVGKTEFGEDGVHLGLILSGHT